LTPGIDGALGSPTRPMLPVPVTLTVSVTGSPSVDLSLDRLAASWNSPTPPEKSAGLPPSGSGLTVIAIGSDPTSNGSELSKKNPPDTITSPLSVIRSTLSWPDWVGNSATCFSVAAL
jgi:hypothetical protein